MPRLYAYPANLSRSVYHARDRARARRVTRREVYKRAAPRRAAFPVRRPAQCPRHAAPYPAAPRRASRGRAPCRRGERGALRCPITRALCSRSPRISRSCPHRLSFFLFLFHSFLFFYAPVSFPSRGLVFVRFAKCPQIPCNVRGHSFDFSPALLGFCYWMDLSVSYNDYCYRPLGIDPGA